MVSGWTAQAGVQASTISFDLQGLWHGFGHLTVDGLTSGAIYALVAIGYTLVFGVLRFVNFAHSSVFMLGTFGSYFALNVVFGFAPGASAAGRGIGSTILYLGVALLIAMAVSATAAVGLEAAVYRPLRKRRARHLDFLIAAIGMLFVIQEFVHFVLPKLLRGYGGSDPQRPIVLVAPKTAFITGPFDIGGWELGRFHIGVMHIPFPTVAITNITAIVVVVAVVLALLTDIAINFTKFGRGTRAVAEDPATATLMGVSREQVILATFLISGLLAGAAALLYTLKDPQGIVYSGGFLLGMKALCAAVLGGIGNPRGALLGGLLLGVIESYGQAVFGGQWSFVVVFIVLISAVIFRPGGILDKRAERAGA